MEWCGIRSSARRICCRRRSGWRVRRCGTSIPRPSFATHARTTPSAMMSSRQRSNAGERKNFRRRVREERIGRECSMRRFAGAQQGSRGSESGRRRDVSSRASARFCGVDRGLRSDKCRRRALRPPDGSMAAQYGEPSGNGKNRPCNLARQWHISTFISKGRQ